MSAGRILILYCEEGEGHGSAARVLGAALEAAGVEAVVHDALQEGLGKLIPWCSRDAYRFQLRWLRWTYGLEYFLFTRLAPMRALARFGLRLFGARPLLRVIERHEPGAIVSTHPAVTNVLGFLRRRGRIGVPTIATVTDFGVHALWANRSVDLHLVMHEKSVTAVERVAGKGSAHVVEALVGEGFRSPMSQTEARLALQLATTGPIAVVSGGGWGVGDVFNAVEVALAAPGLTVVCLSGKNAILRRRLERCFASHSQVVILPFTDRMPELLAAADVLVDTTLGVTCLEALAAGCQVIAFGAPPGHSRDNARALAALGLAETASSSEELAQLLAAVTSDGRRPLLLPDGRETAAAAVVAARPRVQPHSRRRSGLVAVAAATAALLFSGWSFASPTPYPVLAKAFNLNGMSNIDTQASLAGVIVEAPQSQISHIARALSGRDIHASFVVTHPVSPHLLTVVASLRDELLPATSPPGPPGVAMVRFSTHLRRLARQLGLRGRFYYLQPSSGYTLGDYLAARVNGARPVAPAIVVGPQPEHLQDLRAGGLVLVDAAGPYARDSLATAARLLSARELRGVSLAELLASAARA